MLGRSHILTSLGLKLIVGCTLAMITTFVDECRLPQMHGKVSHEWLKPSRLKGTTISSFASIMLSIVPIIALFLEHYNVKSMSPAVVECYNLLHTIISLLKLSPSKVPPYAAKLNTLISAHHRSFMTAYGTDYLKPKSHHMKHVVDGAVFVGKCLSCFVTERKHREIKKSAINVFRNFEATTLRDVLNEQVQYMSSGHDLFRPEFLANVKLQWMDTAHGPITYSTGSAIIHVGEVFTSDIIFMTSGEVLEVVGFYQHTDGEIAILGKALHAVNGDCSVRSKVAFTWMFVKSKDVADVCITLPSDC